MTWWQWTLIGLGTWVVGSIAIGLLIGRLFRKVEEPPQPDWFIEARRLGDL